MIDKLQGNIDFRVMGWLFTIRDIIKPPLELLKKAGIKPGDLVLDYGCGPGSFTFAASEIVGPQGQVISADIHPLAIRMVKRGKARKKSTNIQIVRADSPAFLKSGSFDVVILYDIFHGFSEPETMLNELRRILRPDGFLTFSDHHLERDDILSKITGSGLFRLDDEWKNLCRFIPV